MEGEEVGDRREWWWGRRRVRRVKIGGLINGLYIINDD